MLLDLAIAKLRTLIPVDAHPEPAPKLNIQLIPVRKP